MKEWLLITIAWALVYAADPLYMLYADYASNITFAWSRIMHMWTYNTAFLLLFLIHHYLLVPYFMLRKKVTSYIVGISVLLILFAFFISFVLPDHPSPDRHLFLSPLNAEGHRPPGHMLLAPPDLARLVMAFLMFGVDLGAAAWFNDQKMHERLLILEKQNLKQELEHLRYQINPHFFMNTLNNIHALIDIDQERAKRAVVELSGMMRYSLYEGKDTMTPLSHEVDFLKQYISLMKLRFTNKVKLTCEIQDNLPVDVMMPPLMLATFVENAFKHGISYKHDSYINISLNLDEENKTIHFTCINSRHATATEDGHHGIGLANVRKRLELQYHNTHHLVINDKDTNKFEVTLTLPYS